MKRLKLLLLSYDALADILSLKGIYNVDSPIPQGAKIHNITTHPDPQIVSVILEHESFPLLPDSSKDIPQIEGFRLEKVIEGNCAFNRPSILSSSAHNPSSNFTELESSESVPEIETCEITKVLQENSN